MSYEPEVWVDHDYTPRPRVAEKCARCGNDLILSHHCNDAAMQRAHFPDEPLLTIEGHVVPWELCSPVRAMIAEIERLRSQIARLT